jgi:GNAT superfamily N-acetyltransferase
LIGNALPELLFARHSDSSSRVDIKCGDHDIDKWYRNHSLRDHISKKHVVTCAFAADDKAKPIGFFALSTIAEEANVLPDVGYRPFHGNGLYFPCLRMVYLAVDTKHQSKGIGTVMMGRVITEFANIGEAIGLPMMTLTPLNDRVRKFYGDLGFQKFRKGFDMFLPLASAIEARDLMNGEE